MKIVTVFESKVFASGIDLGDLISELPDGAEEIRIEVEEDHLRVVYCLRVMKKDKSRR